MILGRRKNNDVLEMEMIRNATDMLSKAGYMVYLDRDNPPREGEKLQDWVERITIEKNLHYYFVIRIDPTQSTTVYTPPSSFTYNEMRTANIYGNSGYIGSATYQAPVTQYSGGGTYNFQPVKITGMIFESETRQRVWITSATTTGYGIHGIILSDANKLYQNAFDKVMSRLLDDMKVQQVVASLANKQVSAMEHTTYDQNMEKTKKVFKITPEKVETEKSHFDLGVAHKNAGRYKEAIEEFTQELALNPNNADAYFNLGISYGGAGMHKEALECYKKLGTFQGVKDIFIQSIKVLPDNFMAHFVLGGIYLTLNDRSSALEEYKILKKLNPELANILFDEIYK